MCYPYLAFYIIPPVALYNISRFSLASFVQVLSLSLFLSYFVSLSLFFLSFASKTLTSSDGTDRTKKRARATSRRDDYFCSGRAVRVSMDFTRIYPCPPSKLTFRGQTTSSLSTILLLTNDIIVAGDEAAFRAPSAFQSR